MHDKRQQKAQRLGFRQGPQAKAWVAERGDAGVERHSLRSKVGQATHDGPVAGLLDLWKAIIDKRDARECAAPHGSFRDHLAMPPCPGDEQFHWRLPVNFSAVTWPCWEMPSRMMTLITVRLRI